ncbi:NAD(+) diphosphatase [Oceanirhabdus sp. W0125-5]|uniref:NAD(+) diphosphatase n=1 Tax=Oceanirhabdus sp. W0125-5 TaxID=2999116 RepID=UPI0022F2A5D9|nr:NAD(+) diphosphatase [Oceanirhabdus sp. W0125-5]WBW98575.1 NAD(+) diphosphatase [Oceanirhabdus sp. W0125-5]
MKDTNINKNNTYSYCFLMCKGEIIFKGHEDYPEFLLVSDVEKLGFNKVDMMYIGTVDSNEYYAANLSNDDKIEGYFSKHMSEIYGEVEENIFLLVLRATHLLNWLDKNKYCSCCGKKVQIEPKQTYIECLNCGHITYPRITPAIIVAVLNGDKILLARSPHFPPNLYSLIAGHVDAGEFIETCVKREVKEEVGIEIKNIKYFGSHPWPFPNKLMLGFIAEYSSGELKIDNNEIEAADWFSLDDLPHIPEYKMSYARMMINHILEARKDPNKNLTK